MVGIDALTKLLEDVLKALDEFGDYRYYDDDLIKSMAQTKFAIAFLLRQLENQKYYD